MAIALLEVGMTAKTKPTSWKGFFSFSIATVFFSSFLLCILLEEKAQYLIIMTQACVYLSLLKCWREQLCAEPIGRYGDPGAIFAYCFSGC